MYYVRYVNTYLFRLEGKFKYCFRRRIAKVWEEIAKLINLQTAEKTAGSVCGVMMIWRESLA